ncbi:MAG TPA: hypothetical protein VMC02_09625 [Steroidobacteraceae bacterium]|nr:hypothetical protein [Steroidobacteraceae bacterium]
MLANVEIGHHTGGQEIRPATDAHGTAQRQPGAWSRWLIILVRWLLGLDYLINGFNWFCKIITPYPSTSDFIAFHPPPDIVGALIDNGLLFPLAKATELVTGIALLSDLFVPLALVLAMPVTVSVFVVDALHPHPHLRALLMGSGALIMNLFLLGAYFDHFRPMLATRGRPRLDLRTTGTATPGPAVEAFAALLRALMPLLGAISVLLGMAMVIWLAVMIAQYIGHPAPLSAIHALQPR